MAYDPRTNTGDFVPTNFIWDINLLADTKVDSPEFIELLIRLYQNINNICLTLNIKDSARYIPQEYVNGQLFFANPSDDSRNQRQAFRKLINFGSLPNAGAKSVTHDINITERFSFTRIYAAASDQVGLTYIPIPYSSPTLNKNIQIDVDATNVTITTGIDYTAYTTTYVILEYLKN